MCHKTPNIRRYSPRRIDRIKVPFNPSPISLNKMINVIPIKPIPANTDSPELKLCFTISVSFVASNLGYFKLNKIPISSDTNDNTTDDNNIKIILIKSNLNLIKIITSPTNINGNMIAIDVITIYKTILNVTTGRLFKILNDLLSKDIIELVIEVIKVVKHKKPNINNGVYSAKEDILKLGLASIIDAIRESYFIDIAIQPIMNNTKLKAAFVTNTGDVANLFNSFFMKDTGLLWVLIT